MKFARPVDQYRNAPILPLSRSIEQDPLGFVRRAFPLNFDIGGRLEGSQTGPVKTGFKKSG
jgi:hypothetical protein